VLPAVSFLIRANIKASLVGEIDQSYGTPPAGSWIAAGAFVRPPESGASQIQAEQVRANLAWAF
jgi:hypothetical protein